MAKPETRPVRWGYGVQSDTGVHHVVGGAMLGRCSETSGETWQAEVTAARSQSHRSTAGMQEQHKAKPIRKRMNKPGHAPSA